MTLRLRVMLVLYALMSALPHCSCFISVASHLPAEVRRGKELLSRRGDDTDDDSLRRRILLAAPALLLRTHPANAAETTTEAIRLLSANTLPGLGPPDVYFPAFFVGKWRVTKVISASDDRFWKDLTEEGGVTFPVTVVAEMRFLPYDAGKDFGGDGNPNDVPAIADRSFNERSYCEALSVELGRLYQTKKSMPAIRSSTWTPTDPNVLSLAYVDGSSKEIKVTKRSSDVNNDGGGVFSTEFRRITEAPASASVAGGIPRIYKSRVLSKWKRVRDRTNAEGGVTLVEGLEIVYNENGTFGETKPVGGTGAFEAVYGRDSNDLSDWRSTTTKILMERIS